MFSIHSLVSHEAGARLQFVGVKKTYFFGGDPFVLQTYHHWNLIGRYPQVRGAGYSVALLDSLALSSISGGVCSY